MVIEKDKKVFVAIDIPNSYSRKIYNSLKPFHNLKGISFVKPYNYHITLFYFGYKTDEEISYIVEELNLLFNKIDPFTVELGALDYFSYKNTPRVVFYNVISPMILDLGNLLKNNYGLRQDIRDFIPHLTFLRIGKFGKYDLIFLKKLYKNLQNLDFEPFFIDRIHLKVVKNQENGIKYENLFTFFL